MKIEIEWMTGAPKGTGEYLVTTWEGIVDYDVVYRHSDGYLCWGKYNNVFAWCKLSDIEPYKEEENILNEFIKKITDDTVDIPSEIQEIIDENFFELL